MCGIIGYAGRSEAAPVLLEGLANLENRGYDSAGIAVLSSGGAVAVRKASGKLESLVSSMNGSLPVGNVGIGHTRWATHGEANLSNAHPHLDCRGDVIVVHNGIVENYIELREELIEQGHTFASETDSEVIPNLVANYLRRGCTPEEAVRSAAMRLKGAQAVAVAFRQEPERVMAFRIGNAGGIVVGYGQGEMLLASDLPAIIPHTQRVAFLSAGEMVSVTAECAVYSTLEGAPLSKSPQVLPYDPVSVEKNGYSHFILKEIQEQPQAAIATLRGRVLFDPWDIELDGVNLTDDDLRNIDRVIFVAMGTSFHAAMIGRHMMERLAGIPSESENASEFRYRDPILDSRTLVVSVGQSGETADTLSAMEEASRKGARVITVCNAEGSGATRMAEGCVYLRCGPEIGVASTKTFTCSLEALYILAAYVGKRRGYLPQEDLGDVLGDLARLPDLLGELVSRHEQPVELAELFYDRPHFLYLGRGPNHAVAMEGALKLKEMAYIHAEGYPAGEMKHGPIALVDETMPIVAIAPNDGLRDKMLNSIFEVKARGGTVIAVATDGDEEMAGVADHVLYIPQLSPLLTCILASVPLQLLAYHIAVKRGCDVDQPRNLAKTVTVE